MADEAPQPDAHNEKLEGSLLKLGAKGLVKTWKVRYFLFDSNNCRLYYYKSDKDRDAQGSIDISSASFSFDQEHETHGEGHFIVSTDGRDWRLRAKDNGEMLMWITALQERRRGYNQRAAAAAGGTAPHLNRSRTAGALPLPPRSVASADDAASQVDDDDDDDDDGGAATKATPEKHQHADDDTRHDGPPPSATPPPMQCTPMMATLSTATAVGRVTSPAPTTSAKPVEAIVAPIPVPVALVASTPINTSVPPSETSSNAAAPREPSPILVPTGFSIAAAAAAAARAATMSYHESTDSTAHNANDPATMAAASLKASEGGHHLHCGGVSMPKIYDNDQPIITTNNALPSVSSPSETRSVASSSCPTDRTASPAPPTTTTTTTTTAAAAAAAATTTTAGVAQPFTMSPQSSSSSLSHPAASPTASSVSPQSLSRTPSTTREKGRASSNNNNPGARLSTGSAAGLTAGASSGKQQQHTPKAGSSSLSHPKSMTTKIMVDPFKMMWSKGFVEPSKKVAKAFSQDHDDVNTLREELVRANEAVQARDDVLEQLYVTLRNLELEKSSRELFGTLEAEEGASVLAEREQRIAMLEAQCAQVERDRVLEADTFREQVESLNAHATLLTDENARLQSIVEEQGSELTTLRSRLGSSADLSRANLATQAARSDAQAARKEVETMQRKAQILMEEFNELKEFKEHAGAEFAGTVSEMEARLKEKDDQMARVRTAYLQLLNRTMGMSQANMTTNSSGSNVDEPAVAATTTTTTAATDEEEGGGVKQHEPASAADDMVASAIVTPDNIADIRLLLSQALAGQSASTASGYDANGFQERIMPEDPALLGTAMDERAGDTANLGLGALLNPIKKYYTAQGDTSDADRLRKWQAYHQAGKAQRGDYPRTTELKQLVRSGIPSEYRGKVWLSCVNFRVRKERERYGSNYYRELLETHKRDESKATKQIELDLMRTLPGNVQFSRPDSPMISKLRRVLRAYSWHDVEVRYCQGMNLLAAVLLLYLDEDDAFWGLMCIVEHLMPPSYYSLTLTTSQADQRVLRDTLTEKCPRLSQHLEHYQVDLTLITFNWLLTVFADAVPAPTMLRIWDTFMYEGQKPLFRYAIAILKIAETRLIKINETWSLFGALKGVGLDLWDHEKMTKVAFVDLNPFPIAKIQAKREYHMRKVREEQDQLEEQRREFMLQRTDNRKEDDDD